MKQAIIYIMVSFIAIHLLLGRKVSIPYGILLGQNSVFVFLSAFFLDSAQIPFWNSLYTGGYNRLEHTKIFNKMHDWVYRRKEAEKKRKSVIWLKRLGPPGVIILSAMPVQGGGIWSSVLLSKILKIGKKKMYALVAIGSIIGCLIFVLGTEVLLSALKSLFSS